MSAAAALVPARRAGLTRLLLSLLLLLLAVHAVVAIRHFVAVVGFPYQLDYGEGIVWQQAALIPGPGAYAPGRTLPFIVFHYPPLFHLAARAASLLTPDLLSAGRLVSVLSTLALPPLVAGLVLAGLPGGRRAERPGLLAASVAGLLVLSLHAVQLWGGLMRVDMIALACGFAGLLLGVRGQGRFWPTTGALLLCLAAVFGKQTQLPAGIAVAVLALARNPRQGAAAIGVAGAAGLALVGALQLATDGGFLLNIIGSNVNRMSLEAGLSTLVAERASLPFVPVFVAGFVAVLASSGLPGGLRRLPARLRAMPAHQAARAALLLHFALCTAMLATVLKSGGSVNYGLEWMVSGCALAGIMVADRLARPQLGGRTGRVLCLCLLAAVAVQGWDPGAESGMDASHAWEDALVRRIAAARRPVASEQMALLMRAGKPVPFEASIVTELAWVGRWDEAPLVAMIRAEGFAFMITTDDDRGGSGRRTPAVDAAMRAAYPRVESPAPGIWLHLPAG